MFLLTLFVVASNLKQPRCPITEEWIKNCGICTMKSYQAIKKDIMTFAGK